MVSPVSIRSCVEKPNVDVIWNARYHHLIMAEILKTVVTDDRPALNSLGAGVASVPAVSSPTTRALGPAQKGEGLAGLQTFRSLRHRNYRLLWFGTLFSSSGQWIQQVTLGWLIYQMTGSPFLLGAINGFR